jgi:hypothetical protein
MEEGEFKKLLIAWAGTRTTGYEDKEVRGINIRVPMTQKILELKHVFKLLDEAKKEFPTLDTSGSLASSVLFSIQVNVWKQKWFGGEKE